MDLFHFNLQLPITDPTWIFLLVLLIILFAPILLNKLRIPHIIGMILAGLVIGEHGLNILARDSSFELFGKVGVYYIMFLAGLEMNMSDFKKNRGKAITLGLLAFIIPIGIGMVTNMWLLKYSLLTSILLASMYASHTLVAYPIVIRYGISRHRSVSIAVGGTAVTDTLTLLVLAVISGLFKGEGGGLFWLWLVVKVVVLGTLIMQLFPRIGRWFFRRYDDNVMQFIFVLAMVFLGAGLMEFIGMEGILGAFLVGLVLNRLIPHVSPLMSHLEFVGNALFIPYFLIGVGMLIDIHVIFGGGDALKVAGVMIVVALAGKWVASWLILVTCVVSSFITERAARRVAMDEAHPEEGDAARVPEKILIPVANPATLDYLISLSLIIRDPKQKDNLVALSVINDHTETDRLELQGKRQLERAAKIAASAGINLQCISRYDLNIAAGIIHTAREYDITDLIIGLHYKVNLMDSYFGKLTESLLKGLHREVMVARFLMPLNTLRRIVIAVPPKAEYEAGFQKWVEHFCRMGATLNCRVHFFANEQTTRLLQALVRKKHSDTMAEYSLLDDWDDLLLLTGQVNYDHLLVVISARRGSISYDSSFERLPGQLGKYFSNNSLIVLYPDQIGEPQEAISFANPQGNNESQHYEKVGRWFYKWFKKDN